MVEPVGTDVRHNNIKKIVSQRKVFVLFLSFVYTVSFSLLFMRIM